MVVAMIASEMDPYAKTGGLGDVVGSLPIALAKRGVKVHVFLPQYACVRESRPQLRLREGVEVHFIAHPSYYDRSGLYGDRNGDYPDNLERFSHFCRRALEAMKEKRIVPDLIHAHDWQAAMSVVYLKTKFKTDPFFAKAGSVMMVHNLGYQGIFPAQSYSELDLPADLFGVNGLEFYGKVNLLKGGLLFADALTTVSPTYAREIQQPDQGAGLDGVLRLRSNRLVGILNGLDQEIWNPAADAVLSRRYDASKMAGKAADKTALQQEAGLPVSARSFLIGMVTRIAAQKGLDLVIDALPELEKLKLQLVILGSGDRPIEEKLKKAVRKIGWVRVRFAFDDSFARKVYAGSDAFLMPSRYEPCGLGQMIAMRYGSVPIVRSTGGLADTVVDLEADPKKGNGFCFGPAASGPLVEAVARAQKIYAQTTRWSALRKRCMETDFSWDRPAQEYQRLYGTLTGRK